MRNTARCTFCRIKINYQSYLVPYRVWHREGLSIVHACNLLRKDNRAAHQFLQLRTQPRFLAAGRGDCKKAQDHNEQDTTHITGLLYFKRSYILVPIGERKRYLINARITSNREKLGTLQRIDHRQRSATCCLVLQRDGHRTEIVTEVQNQAGKCSIVCRSNRNQSRCMITTPSGVFPSFND